ncbi:hypothetical protein ABT294_43825 [Nonomuraea sp. NPDC000554]|uniref:hypothetical protein n=1 Tax=Nonomuraea sp. NPDC000554 TaxID=3154259 RepID=UPI00332D520D
MPAIPRRAFLTAAVTAAVTATGATALLAALPPRPALALAQLAPLPAGAPGRRQFVPAEQRYAPYLATLAPMVNDMDDSGFFAGGWWRSPAAPYNARVQEHVYTLSWFYANARPWNPYAGDPVLLSALDAALGHYLSLQHPDGAWPEYHLDQHSMAATGFGLGYLSKTLDVLRRADILPARRTQLSAALRTAMTWFLDPANGTVWQSRLEYANQTSSGLAGSALALKLDPDATLSGRLSDAISRLATAGQSPAGFFYEQRGMDMNYNFEVMLPEMADLYHRTGDPALAAMAGKFAGWLGYNLLREPDGSGYLTNIAPSTRTSTRYYDDVRPDPDRTALNSLFVPDVPALGAFMSARQDLAAARAAWADDPAPVGRLAKQDTSPRILTHALYGEAFPNRGQRGKAIAALPYLAGKRFVEHRTDHGQDFFYLRRPHLYLGGYFGTRATSLTRTGLSFLWHPVAGTVIQSLNDNDYACWATVLPGQAPDADGDLPAEFPGGEPYVLRFRNASVSTEVTVTDGSVHRSVRAVTAATEQIPLILHPTDRLTFTDGTTAAFGGATSALADGLDLRRSRGVIRIRWGAARTATLSAGSLTYFRDGRRRFHALRVPHDGSIDVTITLNY